MKTNTNFLFTYRIQNILSIECILNLSIQINAHLNADTNVNHIETDSTKIEYATGNNNNNDEYQNEQNKKRKEKRILLYEIKRSNECVYKLLVCIAFCPFGFDACKRKH